MSEDFSGEEWKFPKDDSQENIAVDEFGSFIKTFYETLRPVAKNWQKLDKDSLDILVSELEWKVKDENFKKLSFKIRNAYESLLKLMTVLKETDDFTIIENRDILEGHFGLGICCDVYGPSLKRDYRGRNPCRSEQVKMYSALAKARKRAEKITSLPVLDASGQMFDVCGKCPYK